MGWQRARSRDSSRSARDAERLGAVWKEPGGGLTGRRSCRTIAAVHPRFHPEQYRARRWRDVLRSVAFTAVVSALAMAAIALVVWARWRSGSHRSIPQQRAFYFWKTQWSSSPVIERSLADGHIARLYLRFFDVDWDDAAHAALPVSPLQLASPLPVGMEIVPVVFVTNRVFFNTAYADVDALAEHVLMKVGKMAAAARLNPQEVQLDCDWSDATRTRYFRFVDLLRQKLNAQQIRVSATIRLHQIKYAERTGVPPVDRGMLMFYNFGPLRADAVRSSIFNAPDAARYAAHIARYTLPLDLALPLFSWSVHSRDGSVLGLIEKLERADLASADGFLALSPVRYKAVRSFFFRGRYFMDGDELLLEETTPAVTRQAAELAARGARPKPFATIAFFDLDERNLRHYAAFDFHSILAAFQ